jgi:hypothetical protein
MQANHMAHRMPDDAMARPRVRGQWEGHRRFDPRAMRNSIDATPLSYALYVVRNIALCDLLDPSRSMVGAITALEPSWTICAHGVPPHCRLAFTSPSPHVPTSIEVKARATFGNIAA